MRKFRSMIAFLMFGALSIALTSCGDEEETLPTLALSIDKTTAKAGDVVTVSVTAGAENTITTIRRVAKNGAASLGTVDTTIDRTTAAYNDPYTIPNLAAGEVVTLEYTVTDKENLTITKSVTVTVEGADVAATRYTGNTLGSYANATIGSFYNTSNGTVLNVTNARANQASVDIVYSYGSNDRASFYAPDNQTVFGTASNQYTSLDVHNWLAANRNETRFKKNSVLSNDKATFDGLNADGLKTTYENTTGNGGNNATQLLAGDFIVFRTDAGKYGAIYVTSVDGMADGTITFDVAVQP